MGMNQFFPLFPQSIGNPYIAQTNSTDPNNLVAQNYAHMYHMKVMEDMLRTKSEENRKLIEALIQGLNKSKAL